MSIFCLGIIPHFLWKDKGRGAPHSLPSSLSILHAPLFTLHSSLLSLVAGGFRQTLLLLPVLAPASAFRVSPGRASSFWHGPKGTKSPLRGTNPSDKGRPPGFDPLRTPILRGSKIGAVFYFRRAPADTPCHARRPPAFFRQNLPHSYPAYGRLVLVFKPSVCTPNGAGTKVPHHSRRVPWASGTQAYGRRRPEAVDGTGAVAGPGRRKEKNAVQLSGGYPGGPPPGHALWVLSLVQEKVPRLPGRDPANHSACRHPPAKGTHHQRIVPGVWGKNPQASPPPAGGGIPVLWPV